jgi:phosphatidylglycerophosphatase A
MRRIAVLIATVGGAGYAPFASGTVGSAIGVVVYFLTRHWPASWQIMLVILVTIAGTWASRIAARHFDREDPGQVVVDEVAGQLVTLLLLDVHLAGALAGFVLFRVFDIIKPWPARQFEDFPNGVGVMADDLMAGVYAWVCLFVLVRFVPLPW